MKAAEIRELSAEDLQVKLKEAKAELLTSASRWLRASSTTPPA